jgi:hypothetical protein
MSHLQQAKSWAGLLAFIFALSVVGDLYFHYEHSLLKKEFWVHEPTALFKQGETILDNSSSETAIWMSGLDYDLRRRGEPSWLSSILVLIALIQIFWHLNKIQAPPIAVSPVKPAQGKHGNSPSSGG